MIETNGNNEGGSEEWGLPDAFKGKSLHPSLDYENGILSVGFSYATKSSEEKSVYIIAAPNEKPRFLREDSFVNKGATYRYDTGRVKRLLSLDERWGVVAAQAFVKNESTPSKDIIEPLAKEAKDYIGFESDADAYILAAWVIGTYFHRIFNAYPFLNIKAPKGSGKSQCLGFLTRVCFNAIKAIPSLAALSDTVDALRGTYLIDQADLVERKGKEELRDILADSYKRNGGKRRIVSMDKKGGRSVVEFETFSPKAFASIRELPEDLRDRCFVLPLIRSVKAFADPNDSWHDWRAIRGKIYQALLTQHITVKETYEAVRAEYHRNGTLGGRNLELWLPLEVMLKTFGGEFKIEEAKKRFLSQYGFTAEYEPDEFEEQVVLVICSKLKDDTEVTLSPKEISEEISEDFFRSKADARQKAAAVGWAIKKFNLASGKGKRGNGVSYLFQKEKVEAIREGYFKTTIQPLTPTEDTRGASNKGVIEAVEMSPEDSPF